MLPIRGVYEIAIRVKDLGVSEPFYRETLGLEHQWMPARSLYFSDPDGHQLELCAPPARP